MSEIHHGNEARAARTDAQEEQGLLSMRSCFLMQNDSNRIEIYPKESTSEDHNPLATWWQDATGASSVVVSPDEKSDSKYAGWDIGRNAGPNYPVPELYIHKGNHNDERINPNSPTGKAMQSIFDHIFDVRGLPPCGEDA